VEDAAAVDEREDRTVFRPIAGPRPASASSQQSAGESGKAPPAFPAYDDHTIFRPNPGGRRSGDAAATGRGSPQPAPRQSLSQGEEIGVPNENPFLQAAGPLLLLLGRLRSSLIRAQISNLIPQIADAVQKFETTILASGTPREEANAAKYALCATADEILANLPGDAPQFSLVKRFFGESVRSQRFFEDIERVKADPTNHFSILELQHACLALGFQNSQRTIAAEDVNARDIRRDLLQIMQRTRPVPVSGFSPHWQGQALPAQAVRLQVPFWVVAGIIGLGLFILYVALRTLLGLHAESVAQAITALNPPAPIAIARRVSVPPPSLPPLSRTQASQIDRLRNVLGPNIAAGALSVDASANQIIIRIADQALFQANKTALVEDFKPLAMYMAAALDDEKGPIKVVGHMDNRPAANSRFASNFDLSLDRAKAVAGQLRQFLSQPERVQAEGKGTDVPLATNDTIEGRNKNRRVEIIIARSD
jgi:type VI secretion system protein ImpK